MTIPIANKMPVSRFRPRMDIDKITIINIILTTVTTMISVVIKVPVLEREAEIF